MARSRFGALLKVPRVPADEATMSVLIAIGIIFVTLVGVLFTFQWRIAAQMACQPRERNWTRGFVPADLEELGHRLALVEAQFRSE